MVLSRKSRKSSRKSVRRSKASRKSVKRSKASRKSVRKSKARKSIKSKSSRKSVKKSKASRKSVKRSKSSRKSVKSKSRKSVKSKSRKSKSRKECPQGWVRNPETGRCRLTKEQKEKNRQWHEENYKKWQEQNREREKQWQEYWKNQENPSASSSYNTYTYTYDTKDTFFKGIQDFEKKCNIKQIIPSYEEFTNDELNDKDSFNKKYRKTMLKVHPDRLVSLSLSPSDQECVTEFSQYLNSKRDSMGWNWRSRK